MTIGLYGVVASQEVLDEGIMFEAFSKMSNDTDRNDFYNQAVSKRNFSVGITLRTIGENKDLALKAFNKDLVIGFNGYGKFTGENKLYWANEMIEHLAPILREKGKNALAQIEGSFSAFVLRENELIIISDRLGSKNMYYYETKNILIFAPDIGRILASNLVPKQKNIEAATQILISGFFLDDSTLVKNIIRFPYATLFTKKISDFSKASQKKYWIPPEKEGAINNITPELIETFYSKMEQSIAELADLEKMAIVPLSGGLDSRAIACFVSKRQTLTTVTHDYGDETSLAKKVCDALRGDFDYFSNAMIESDFFKESLRKLIVEQKIHVAVEQYFYTPFFKEYFTKNSSQAAIYDGVYMDILFSAPYTYQHFDFENYVGVYGGGIGIIEKFSQTLNREKLLKLMKEKYKGILKDLGNADGIGKSQLFYISGRLRRYVNERVFSKENYCYVLKPAYNYDLMDFGFSLSRRLRRGLIYNELFKEFHKVMKIPYKDSYGTRDKTNYEKIMNNYVNFRLKLSYFTQGVLKYSADQRNYFFYTKQGIDDYKALFLNHNCINEIFNDSEMLQLFNMIKRKQYFLQLYERVLFLQQFYSRYNF